MSYREFLTYCFSPGEWRRRDLDLLDIETVSQLADWGSVMGGASVLGKSTLSRWADLLLPVEHGYRGSWISSLWVTRYCPECLTEDRHQYLRLGWRLHLSPICPKHGLLLLNACGRCHRSQAIAHFIRGDVAGACVSCGYPLSDGEANHPANVRELLQFTLSLHRMLEMRQAPDVDGWSGSVQEFLGALKFTVRLLGLSISQEGRLGELSDLYGLPHEEATDWRNSEAAACILISESLKAMEDWPENFVRLLRLQRPLLNPRYLGHSPKYLVSNPAISRIVRGVAR